VLIQEKDGKLAFISSDNFYRLGRSYAKRDKDFFLTPQRIDI
jgi:hypothetical protein